MDDMAFQDIFNRLYGYLRESDVTMTSDRFRQLLLLIDDAIESVSQRGDDATSAVLDAAMDRMEDYFPATRVALAEVSPPLKRGSIGYARSPATGEQRGSH
ncbi:hypothetical protein [Marinobacter apostichopi]|uniref:hypothetical protein n=1 Tax=Marinobacter apostichopi TaxID=3035454 RepID=UPI0025732F79|nr:hypothetical protein [Marinobacter sp. LA51]